MEPLRGHGGKDGRKKGSEGFLRQLWVYVEGSLGVTVDYCI